MSLCVKYVAVARCVAAGGALYNRALKFNPPHMKIMKDHEDMNPQPQNRVYHKKIRKRIIIEHKITCRQNTLTHNPSLTGSKGIEPRLKERLRQAIGRPHARDAGAVRRHVLAIVAVRAIIPEDHLRVRDARFLM